MFYALYSSYGRISRDSFNGNHGVRTLGFLHKKNAAGRAWPSSREEALHYRWSKPIAKWVWDFTVWAWVPDDECSTSDEQLDSLIELYTRDNGVSYSELMDEVHDSRELVNPQSAATDANVVGIHAAAAFKAFYRYLRRDCH